MANIQKPFSLNLNAGQAIDAKLDNKITWKISGATQTAYSVQIINNSTGSTAFTVAQTTTYNLYYTLPANSLTNGNEYKILITVYDASGNSATNDAIIFQTSSTPTVTVDTIGTVANSSYNFTATYSQAESVAIKSYIVILYDSNKIKITDSGILTSTPLEYMFTDLANGETYYIEFQVTSSKTLTGTSGLISFNVSYLAPNINVSLTAENTDNAGISLSLKTVQIVGKETGTVTFPDNTTVDVTQGSVYFQDGFIINGTDFTLKYWVKSPENKVDLFSINGANGQITLQYHIVDQKFHLYRKINNSLTTSWLSEAVTGSSFFVYVQQIGGNFNIHAESLA